MSQNPSQSKETELEKKLAEIQVKRVEEEAASLAQKLGLPFSDLKSAPIDNDALVLLGEEEARRANLAVIIRNGTNLTAAVLNPEDPETAKVLGDLEKKGFKVSLIVTDPAALAKV